jgi:hypothetical protein
MIRDELESQSGRDPLTAFELNLGRFTTLLIKSALDVTRIGVRGWEQVVRFLDQQRSGMVLIKPSGEDIGDLVVVGAGKKTVLCA